MLRLLFIQLLLLSIVHAKGKDSCYTVQLKSSYANNINRNILKKSDYPSSCQIMHISNVLTVRCGCYDTIAPAKEKLKELHQKYTKATIATTYKYRFTNTKTIPIRETKQVKQKKSSSEEQDLKLIFQSFLYVKDLDDAYKTALIGYNRNPDSLYWNQKMAEISRWSGRGDEALKYMIFVYNKKHSQQLQSDIINYGLSSYQYEKIEPMVVQEVVKNPTEKNIDRMVFVYSKIGLPQRSAEILLSEYKKNPTKSIYLAKALEIYINMGELELAKKVVDKLEQNRYFSVQNAELISRYYYIKKDMPQSYKALLRVDSSRKDFKYYELLSDIGWYLQKSQVAADASLVLYKMNKARLVDYERIALMKKDTDLALVAKSSLLAYKKYKISYIFYGYANYALNNHKFDILNQDINKLDAENSTLRDDYQYWLIKAKLYIHYNDKLKALQALKKSLKMSENSTQIQLTMIYFYIQYGFNNELKTTLDLLAQDKNLSNDFYFPLASSYYYLQDVNLAAYYMNKVIDANLAITKTIDFKFLQAYIYQSKSNQASFLKILKEIREELQEEARKTPTLLEDDTYLNNYFNASINLISADKFKKELKRAKPYLHKDHYRRLLYNFASKHQEADLKHAIYNKIEKKDLWLRFSNAVMLQNHSEIENMLYLQLKQLSMNDASVAAKNDGQISLAQTLAYQALSKNDDSQTAYISHLNLSKERTDLFRIKPSYYVREPLHQDYLTLENSTYLKNDLYIFSNIKYYSNNSMDTTILHNIPNKTLQTGFALKKELNRGFIRADINYHNSMCSYLSYKLNGEYRSNRYIKSSFTLAKNIDVQESTQLLLAGKKDMLEAKILWTLFPSTSIETLYQYNNYNSQDDVHLGNSNYLRAMISYQIRSSYPDLRIATFVDNGIYSETNGSRGVIDELQAPNQKVLPEDYYNVGLNFSYGMTNSKIYTRVWRPFFTISSYYNSFAQNTGYGGSVGYGGKVNTQDHLVFSANYSDSVNGIDGSTFEIFMKYEFLYDH
jgi:hypothetical protein